MFPTTDSDGRLAYLRGSAFAPLPPTVAGRLSFVRRAAKHALLTLGLGSFLVVDLDRTDLGVGFRLDGVCMGCCISLLRQARNLLSDFTAGRRVGCHSALARPI